MPIPDVRLNIPLLAISPDSTQLVYVANLQLFLRSLSEMEAHSIPGTVGDPSNPMISPDGDLTVAEVVSDPVALADIQQVGEARDLADGISAALNPAGPAPTTLTGSHSTPSLLF